MRAICAISRRRRKRKYGEDGATKSIKLVRGRRETHPVQLALAICSFQATAHSSWPGSRIGNFKYNIEFCATPTLSAIHNSCSHRSCPIRFLYYNVLCHSLAKHALRKFLLILLYFLRKGDSPLSFLNYS